jgi:hypothetical protein
VLLAFLAWRNWPTAVSTTNRRRSAQNGLPCFIFTCNMQYQDVSSTVISRNLPVFSTSYGNCFHMLSKWYRATMRSPAGPMASNSCIFLGFTPMSVACWLHPQCMANLWYPAKKWMFSCLGNLPLFIAKDWSSTLAIQDSGQIQTI